MLINRKLIGLLLASAALVSPTGSLAAISPDYSLTLSLVGSAILEENRGPGVLPKKAALPEDLLGITRLPSTSRRQTGAVMYVDSTARTDVSVADSSVAFFQRNDYGALALDLGMSVSDVHDQFDAQIGDLSYRMLVVGAVPAAFAGAVIKMPIIGMSARLQAHTGQSGIVNLAGTRSAIRYQGEDGVYWEAGWSNEVLSVELQGLDQAARLEESGPFVSLFIPM